MINMKRYGVGKNRNLPRDTEYWRNKLEEIPDSQERNVVALLIWWQLLANDNCTSPELPIFLAEFHTRYRANKNVPDKAKTEQILKQLGIPKDVCAAWLKEGYNCDTFKTAPEDIEGFVEILRERIATKKWRG